MSRKNSAQLSPDFVHIADQLQQRIYVKDKERRFVFANKATLAAHGVQTLEELLRKQDENYFEGSHLATARQDELDILSGKLPGLEEKSEWETWKASPGAFGRLTFVVTAKLPLRDEKGHIVGIVGISRETSQPDVGSNLNPGIERKNVGMYVREVEYISEVGVTKAKRRVRAWYSEQFFETFPGEKLGDRLKVVHPKDKRRVTRFLASISPRLGQRGGHDTLFPSTAVFRIEDRRLGAQPRSWRWIQVVGYIESCPGPRLPRLIVVHYDADGRAEELLGVQVVKESPLFIFVKDEQKRHQFMNPALLKFFGKSLHDVIGYTDKELGIPEEQAKKFESDDTQVIHGGVSVRKEEQLTVGSFGPIDLLTAKVPLPSDVFVPATLRGSASGKNKLHHVLGIAADVEIITKVRNIEHALSETLFHATRDGVSIKNDRLQFVRVNRAFADFFCLPESAFPGRSLREVLAEMIKLKPDLIHVIDAIDCQDREVLNRESGESIETRTIELPNSEPVTTHTRKVRLATFPFCDGPVVLAISTDITKAIQAEVRSAYLPAAIRSDPITPPSFKDIAVMFVDLRGFTDATSKLEVRPELLTEFLDTWHTTIEELSLKQPNCMVDKFIGDGAMLLFGARSQREDEREGEGEGHDVTCCAEACRFALLLETEFARISREWVKKSRKRTHIDLPPLSLGLGISHGKVFVGHFNYGRGSHQRIHYTAIGSTVNLAARLEGIAQKPEWEKKDPENPHQPLVMGPLRPSMLVSQNVAFILEAEVPSLEFSGEMRANLRGFGDTAFRALLGESTAPKALGGIKAGSVPATRPM